MTNSCDNVGFWDSVLIENLTEETFTSNIYQRYRRGLIYTYIGAFLVAVNPYRPVANYSTETLRTYACSSHFKLPPHIYGLSNQAYRNLLDQNENQCICILGEKGSGKTESARIILHFLTRVKEKGVNDEHRSGSTLMRCKSLVSYPQRDHEIHFNSNSLERKSALKCHRRRDKVPINVSTIATNQYKSLDDVSFRIKSNKCTATSKYLQQPNASVTFKNVNQKQNCDDTKFSLTKSLQCDKTPIRTKNLLITKRALHQIGCVRHDNKSPLANCERTRSHEEPFNQNYCNSKIGQTTFCRKSTNLSTHSLNLDQSHCGLLRRQIVSAFVLLEAFGNARCPANSNSSRFGSFYDVEINFKGDPISAHINFYLLEKSRVTERQSGERNFHIFFQLLMGADIHLLKSIKLQRNIEKYQLLGKDCATDVDKDDFTYTKEAFETLGFTSDDILSVFKILAVILKMGNLIFVPTTNIDGTCGCEITNDFELLEISELLELDANILNSCLVKSDTKWSFLDCDSDLDAQTAINLRNCLCRNLYGRLFTWIVSKINESCKRKNANSFLGGKRVGILDFFGFENEKPNHYEQFIINYCNERIHQNYLQMAIKIKQELYVREGLEWTHVDFFDNAIICDLLDKPNHGILQLIDEPQVKDDEAFMLRVRQCCAGHPNYLGEENFDSRRYFQIRHFAGPVNYRVDNFVEKNSDRVRRNIGVALFQSTLPIVRNLFPEGNPHRISRDPSSISTTIRTQLQSFLTLLKDRRSHFVFCVKPNELKKAHLFEFPLVQHQIRYMSLMPVVKIWRIGYCFHMSHAAFLNRYKMLHNDTWPFYHTGSIIEGVATIIQGLPLPSAEFVLGCSSVFVRSPRTVFELEAFRRVRLSYLIVVIQSVFRCYVKRRYFLRLRKSQITIARTWRQWRECRFGVCSGNKKHFWELYDVATEKHRISKYRKVVQWAVDVIERQYIRWKQRQFLTTLTLRLPANSMSPISCEWITAPSYLVETSRLLRQIFHRWRSYKYRQRYDQVARNRMREKLTASLIFKNRKSSYALSVPHPFLGDYVRLRQNIQWKKLCMASNDQYIVFADLVEKVTRSTGKMTSILMALSTNAMLLMDQRTLQIKYRIPATEIYRLSLSPYHDNIAVFHVKASEAGKKKGDFVFHTAHIIEVITKLFLVIQNAAGRPPEICIDSEFEVTFANQTVILSFHFTGIAESFVSNPKITRKNDRMEIVV